MEPDDDKTRTHVALTKGTMVGRYRIVEKIGAGGMGEVYLAQDTELDRKVALKFLPPHLCQDEDCRKRFKREAQAAAKLRHPNIITIYEVGDYEGRPFFAMEHVEGHSLHHFAHEKPLPVEQVIDIAIQIGEGLHKAHQAGIVHRDIKASNIVIDNDGRPIILDFGLAAVQGKEKLTRTGSTLGTVAYMSPEQAKGKEVDQRSDLFSFGCVLYELLAGRTPFRRDTEAAILQAIISDDPEPLARYKAGLPDGLQSIIDKTLDKNVETRYQHADGMLADLKRLRGSIAVLAVSPLPEKTRSRLPRYLIPALILIAGALLLVMKPWKIEVQPSHEVIAAENRLAVMYFDNLADPMDSLRLGEIIANLLITDLSESHYVQVVSSQRLYDILKLLGREGQKRVDRSVATQIAEKAGAKWMLLGSILNMEPEIIITAQLIDVNSGTTKASQRITGQPGERVFPLVDKLTVEIKSDLALPSAASSEADPMIADVTTHSSEAYRYYLEGVELGEKHYWSEADGVFTRALDLDSTLAMAYYWLATMDYWRDRPTAKDHITNALKYSGNVSEIKQHYIYSLDARIKKDYPRAIAELQEIINHHPEEKDAYLTLGLIKKFRTHELQDAVACFEKVVELDPLQREAYNQLAYSYSDLGRFADAIVAINKYIEIAPDEANPYDSKAEILALNGKLDEAIASYEKAMELKPGFARSQLANMYMFRREYDRAESLYQSRAADANRQIRARGRLELTRIPRYQGKFSDALRLLGIGIETDRLELGEGPEVAGKLWLRAVTNEYFGDENTAIDDLERAIAIMEQYDPGNANLGVYRAYLAGCYAKDGNLDTANRLISEIATALGKSETPDSIDYWLGRALTAQSLNNFDTACVYLEKTIRLLGNQFPLPLFLGRSYLGAGKLGDAVATLEGAMQSYSEYRAKWPELSVLGHYWLGRAYEASGWTDKAIGQYETFLDIWKDADPGIAEVEDATDRLTRLRNGA